MTAIRRVFLSHTSEFTKFPEKKSFIDAAIAAINRAGMVPIDMEYFTARDEKPAKYCEDKVRACDLYVGIIGSRYGSPVRDRLEVSYTELEFESASKSPAMKRLVFLLDENALVPHGLFNDQQYGGRQATFRRRISDAGVMCKAFGDVHELEKLVYQALIEEVTATHNNTDKHARIDWPVRKSPYPGLLSFDQVYAELFFGREHEVSAVIGKMTEPEGRLVVISGASGSGKSSLVGAGVWRALIQEDRIPGSRDWSWLRIHPGDGNTTPFEALAWGLKQTPVRFAQRPEKLAEELAAQPSRLGMLLGEQLSGDQELLLFVDQLEELFTQGFADGDIRNFLEQLVATSGDKKNRFRVIASLRSEFIARLEESESVRALLNAGYNFHLGPVSPKVLPNMIEKPAQATGYDFESQLVDDILRDAAQEPGGLPLVAYALKQLFDRRRGRTFTRDAYKEIEGVAGAIGKQADQVIDGLDAEAIAAFDRVFAELVYIERDRPPSRKRCQVVAFKYDSGAEKLIDALTSADCRIMVTGGDGGDATVEVAHEKLFTAWPRLKEWINKSGEALRLIEHAKESAQRWHNDNRSLSKLWSANDAVEVSETLETFGKKATVELESFLRPQQVLIDQLDRNPLSHEQREQIGKKLEELGDPRPGVGLRLDGLPNIEWVDIPAGKVWIEDVKEVFDVKAFRIAKYLVTNKQFKAFIKAADGYKNKEWWQGIKQSESAMSPKWAEDNCPRETVSWYEAIAFCRWLSKRLGLNIRLPTEWEWQQAATGGDAEREYPWKGGWDAGLCNSYEGGLKRTTAVGVYPNGVTKQGVLDMAGNVWEWCLNKYEQGDNEESLRIDDSDAARVFRGGSWGAKPATLRSRIQDWNYAYIADEYIGFRLAQYLD